MTPSARGGTSGLLDEHHAWRRRPLTAWGVAIRGFQCLHQCQFLGAVPAVLILSGRGSVALAADVVAGTSAVTAADEADVAGGPHPPPREAPWRSRTTASQALLHMSPMRTPGAADSPPSVQRGHPKCRGVRRQADSLPRRLLGPERTPVPPQAWMPMRTPEAVDDRPPSRERPLDIPPCR